MEVMEVDVKVHSNEEVTIPAEMVTKMGLYAGDDVRILEHDGCFHLIPLVECDPEIRELFEKEQAPIDAQDAAGLSMIFC